MGFLATGLRSYFIGEKSLRDPTLAMYFGGGPTTSGANVTEWTALNYSAWWAATQIVANAIATFPLSLYRRLPDGGREDFITHPLRRILHKEFNPNQTSFTARKQMMEHVLCWGNAYAEIERTVAGQPLYIWPITPDRVTPDFRNDGSIFYRVQQPRGREVQIDAADMLHIKGLSFDGIVGYSVIRKARETIGLGMATENFGAQFFGNGAISGLVAMHPGTLTENAKNNITKSIQDKIGGQKKHSVLVLEEGMKVEKTSIPPDDAQFLETRVFGIREVARWFGIPPHKIGDLERATFSNIEEQNRDYYNDCINPHLTNWEQEYDRKLIRPLEQTIQYTKHNVDALLRPRALERAQVLEIKMRNSAINADDWRALDDENPLPDGLGKKYYMPLNMAPVDRIDEVIDKQVSTAPSASPAPAAAASPNGNENRPRSDPEAAAKVIAAHRAMIIEAVGRMTRREAQAARRAAKKGAVGLRKWSEEFYPKQATIMRDHLMPSVSAHLTYVAATTGAQGFTAQLVDEYVARSVAEIEALPSEEMENAVDRLVSRWEIQRPPEVADALMTEELSHALKD
jgi:HK97 family phage portal protein